MELADQSSILPFSGEQLWDSSGHIRKLQTFSKTHPHYYLDGNTDGKILAADN